MRTIEPPHIPMSREQAESLAAFIERHDPRYHKAQVITIFKRSEGTRLQVMATHVNGSIADYPEIEVYATEARANVEDPDFQAAVQAFAEEQGPPPQPAG